MLCEMRRHGIEWHRFVDQMTGYTWVTIEAFWAAVGDGDGATIFTLVDSMLMLINNLTWDSLQAVSVRGVNERQLRRDFDCTARRVAARWFDVVDPQVRFSHTTPLLPYVTAILDGSPIPCRATGGPHQTASGATTIKNFNGKYRIRCAKVEVWTTLQGVPIGFRGPVHGKNHDMSSFSPETPLPFTHLKSELFLGDSGYFGAAHQLLPFKKNEACGQELLDDGATTYLRYWNSVHSQYRSRVERFFAWSLRWKFLSACDHNLEWLRNAMVIHIAFEHRARLNMPLPYPQEPLPSRINFSKMLVCNCNGCGEGKDFLVVGPKRLRSEFALRLWKKNYKPPRLKPSTGKKRPRGEIKCVAETSSSGSECNERASIPQLRQTGALIP